MVVMDQLSRQSGKHDREQSQMKPLVKYYDGKFRNKKHFDPLEKINLFLFFSGLKILLV